MQGTDISSIESKPALLQEYLDFLANALNEMIKSSLFEEEISFRTVRVVISFGGKRFQFQRALIT